MKKLLNYCYLLLVFCLINACGGGSDDSGGPYHNDPRGGNNPNNKPNVDPLNELLDDLLKNNKPHNSSNNKPITDGKFRVYKKDNIKETFKDIIGLEEAKASLQTIVSYLADPKKITRFDGKPPKGVLFYGPPGTGKTAIARALAGEVNKNIKDKNREVSFIVASGAEFQDKYVGGSAKNVRKLFALARKNAPCIIFIDEFDALAGKRDDGTSKNVQMVNQLLTELGGFEKLSDVFIVAATNNPDNIDDAVKRSGRIDLKVEIGLPDEKARRALFKHFFTAKNHVIKGVDIDMLVKKTKDWSASDIETLVNQARVHAAEIDGKTKVDMSDFNAVITKIKRDNP